METIIENRCDGIVTNRKENDMKEKWILEAKKADFSSIADRHKISPVLARIMINRGVTTEEDIDRYLYGKYDHMHSPKEMKDILKAVDMLAIAIQKQETISIATDFDNDGLLSGFTLHIAIERVGGKAEVYAPDRILEGYGLNKRIVNEAFQAGSRFLITCDNGIAAFEAISYAKSLGFQVVVTDHHEVGFEEDEVGNRRYVLPEADAIVNPKQEDCAYPFKGLCGAGVVYKVIELLYEKFGVDKEELYSLLEFTAIATVADVMDLVDENRIIVKRGLELIKDTKNLGLKALIEVNQLNKDRISAYHIGFVIGPCFNAAGRLETVKLAFDLLQSKTEADALRLAIELKALNDSRKEMTVKGVEQAIEQIETTEIKKDKVILVLLKDTHESLAGIIAGRIRENYHKPALVFVKVEEGIKGSGRSIEAYNMFEGLNRCKNLLSKFGGHPMAAGLTLKEENLEELRRRLNEDAELTEEDFIPVVRIDVPMPIGYITENFIQELELLEPFGKGNPKPLFAEQHFQIKHAKVLGKNQNVLKMNLLNESGNSIEALYFGNIDNFNQFVEEEYGEIEVSNMYKGRDSNVDLAFTYYPSINEYMGNKSLQIVIQNYCRIQRK